MENIHSAIYGRVWLIGFFLLNCKNRDLIQAQKNYFLLVCLLLHFFDALFYDCNVNDRARFHNISHLL